MRRSIRILALPVLALMAPGLGTGGLPRAQETPAGSDWAATYDWTLEVDGKSEHAARFFQEKGSSRLLVLAPGLEQVVLLDQKGKIIREMDREQIAVGENGTEAHLPAGAEEDRPTSTYSIGNMEVIFYLGNNRLKILPKRPLEGTTDPEEIFRHSPLYKVEMDKYTPDGAAIDAIRAHPDSVDIEVFFGTWCPHCKIVVPKFMKSIAMAANSHLRISYVGVPRIFTNFAPARAKGVRSVPTMIFYSGGREFGRLPGGETPDASIEQAVAAMLQAGR